MTDRLIKDRVFSCFFVNIVFWRADDDDDDDGVGDDDVKKFVGAVRNRKPC